jgi:hypothetical protein
LLQAGQGRAASEFSRVGQFGQVLTGLPQFGNCLVEVFRLRQLLEQLF